jgi:alpha-beta hydrolase superfamily lysophospholipase
VVRLRSTAVAALAALAGCAAIEAQALVGPMPGRARSEPGEPLELLTADGVRLHGYLVRARGRSHGAALLLHGFGDDGASFARVAQAFAAAGYDAAAWDARGHGSSGGRCSYGTREYRDVSTVLDAIARRGADASRALLVGFSMGAAVALRAARFEPRVRAVVAVAPWSSLDEVIRRTAWAAPRRALDGVIRAAERTADFRVAEVRPIDDARMLPVPLLAIAGTADPLAPPPDVAAIVRAAGARARLVEVRGAGHLALLDCSCPTCNQALAELLAEVGMR